jgi:hypothetical protein
VFVTTCTEQNFEFKIYRIYRPQLILLTRQLIVCCSEFPIVLVELLFRKYGSSSLDLLMFPATVCGVRQVRELSWPSTCVKGDDQARDRCEENSALFIGISHFRYALDGFTSQLKNMALSTFAPFPSSRTEREPTCVLREGEADDQVVERALLCR